MISSGRSTPLATHCSCGRRPPPSFPPTSGVGPRREASVRRLRSGSHAAAHMPSACTGVLTEQGAPRAPASSRSTCTEPSKLADNNRPSTRSMQGMFISCVTSSRPRPFAVPSAPRKLQRSPEMPTPRRGHGGGEKGEAEELTELGPPRSSSGQAVQDLMQWSLAETASSPERSGHQCGASAKPQVETGKPRSCATFCSVAATERSASAATTVTCPRAPTATTTGLSTNLPQRIRLTCAGSSVRRSTSSPTAAPPPPSDDSACN
mmetsp:Transcript_80619/g.231457  ORF Transcript_80619/g.231457 Transcript_80619/m.231457 type:complete len:264 (+) Transcript_80619:675-1466(+)